MLPKLVNLFFIFVLMPFVSPYPIGSDVQPIVGIMAFIIIIYLFFKDKLKFNTIDSIFICTSILSLVYFSFFLEGDWDFRKRIGLLFAFIIFYVVKKMHLVFDFKVFYTVVLIYFFGSVLHLLFPEQFAQYAGYFVRVIKQSDAANLGYRGISSFAPEPNFLGALSVFFLLVLHYFNQREFVNRFYNWSTVALCIFMIVNTKSGTGYVYLALFVIFWLYNEIVIKHNFIYLIGSLFLLSFNAYTVVTSNLKGRGISVFNELLSNPIEAIGDDSIAHRVSNIYTAIYSLNAYPLGTGVGTFSYTAQEMYYKHKLYGQFLDIQDYIGGAVSAFAQYSVEMGIIFIIFIIIILSNTYICQTSLMFRAFAIIFVVFSFSITFPPTWFLLATTSRMYFNKVVCFGSPLLDNNMASHKKSMQIL